MTRKGISVTITILITVVVLFAVGLLLIGLSNTTVSRAMSSIGETIGVNQETSVCNAIRTKCETRCGNACVTGSGSAPGEIIIEYEEDGETRTAACGEHSCMTDWSCSCGD